MDPYERIIWSADVPDEETLFRCLGLMPKLRFVKLDRLLLTRAGLGLITRVRARGFQVFADAKLVEIPSKLSDLAELHLAELPFMLNCMAGCVSNGVWVGSDTEVDGLKRFADACHKVGTRPCGVTVLTSKREEVVRREYGRTPIEQALYYVELLLQCGFTDVICSPREVGAIRVESRFDNLGLNTPGIRLATATGDDQARIDTPSAALAAGATRLVIGRPITDGDLAANLQRIVESITSI